MSLKAIKLGQTIQMLENILNDDSVELLMLAAGQHSLTVRFKDLLEDSTQKTFICQVEIDNLLDECIGFGQSKREAKLNAADEAISQLKENLKGTKQRIETQEEPPSSSSKEFLSPSKISATNDDMPSANRFSNHTSSFLTSSLNANSTSTFSSVTHNPIGALQELATRRGWSAPEYKEIDEYGEPHCKTFVTECKVKNTISQGQGSTKKAAKKQAAEKMLEQVHPTLNDSSLTRTPIASGCEQRDSPRSTSTKAAIARAYGREFPLPSFEKMKITCSKTSQREEGQEELERKASKNKWWVKWYDFEEKGYSGNYQCFVKVSTSPVTVCSGSGPTVSSAHDDAAMNALNYLKK